MPASAAELREPLASAFGRSTSPFAADGPSCPDLPAMAHQTSCHQAQAGLVPTWGESSFGLAGGECGSGSAMWDCEPVAPARRTAEGLDALSFAFIQSQQPQDQLINRPGLSVSEHPCTLLRAPSGGYSLINTASIAAAAPLDAAAVILPQPAAVVAAAVPAAAATPACSESWASPAPSTERRHDATSAATSSGATSSCGGSDMPEDAAAEVQQRASTVEAQSSSLPQESHAFAAAAAASSAVAESARPAAEVEQVGPPGTAALAAMRASGRMSAAAAATAMPASGRVGQKRRAAATAAVVVLEAARDDEDDDEDYDEREEGGAGGRGSAKRVKRVVGAQRMTTNKPKTGVTCRNCRATETPQWRCGPEGPRTLCNACGVRYKKGQTLEYMAKKAAAAAARGRTGGGDA
ncbi:hypothetical protein HYH02_006104 [Chlamydomonas schloesseri]|uniref:GATA-type domain-containing protein n=1 Tax=Chlamydomonas schloesseri TaxID=2026947 RepID=A0A835WJT1_9CHLO|nr:hypothetical protein HYH02_006104 [Chlamydomonas schloesseri]|eukprot:KAG2448750.1 hypothetical protein HYH02_006104 [Chlamydomonas schloesseri]